MKIFRTTLGEFEELVLLIVTIFDDQAYGISIQEEIEKQTGREISISAIHSALQRLEEKGYLVSRMGGQSQVRGGRRKRYFKVTGKGKNALVELKSLRDGLWKLIPNLH